MEHKRIINEILKYSWDRAILEYTKNRFIGEEEVNELFSIFSKLVNETISEIELNE